MLDLLQDNQEPQDFLSTAGPRARYETHSSRWLLAIYGRLALHLRADASAKPFWVDPKSERSRDEGEDDSHDDEHREKLLINDTGR